MKVETLLENIKTQKIANSKVNPNALAEYLEKALEIKTYIPFQDKRDICEIVVEGNIHYEGNVVKIDSVGQYMSFITAMLTAHTNLEFSENPIADYDLLAEAELIEPIVALFQQSYAECDVILKMLVSDRMSDNQPGCVINTYLMQITDRIEDLLDGFDISSLLGDQLQTEGASILDGLLKQNIE